MQVHWQIYAKKAMWLVFLFVVGAVVLVVFLDIVYIAAAAAWYVGDDENEVFPQEVARYYVCSRQKRGVHCCASSLCNNEAKHLGP